MQERECTFVQNRIFVKILRVAALQALRSGAIYSLSEAKNLGRAARSRMTDKNSGDTRAENRSNAYRIPYFSKNPCLPVDTLRL
ncbi:MAG: hypothetical protein IJW70_08485 [Clostridia bacterium]|nr:hypothetical protein [Clostridia bacterium]